MSGRAAHGRSDRRLPARASTAFQRITPAGSPRAFRSARPWIEASTALRGGSPTGVGDWSAATPSSATASSKTGATPAEKPQPAIDVRLAYAQVDVDLPGAGKCSWSSQPSSACKCLAIVNCPTTPRARRMGVARAIGYDARVAIGSAMSLPAMDQQTLRGRHVSTFNSKESR